MYGALYLIFACSFGLATGIVGRIKGSSFLLWFVIGAVLPVAGLIAALLYRWEGREAQMRCPSCGKTMPIYVQVCTRCGEDIVWEVPPEGEGATTSLRQPEGESTEGG